MKTGVIYSRDSRDDGADAFGIDRQTRFSSEYAVKHGITIPDGLIFEEEMSGVIWDRPKFNELKRLIETHAIDAVIVYKVNRISRIDYHALMFLREYIFRHKVELHIVEWGRIVRDSNEDTTLFSLQSLFGHIERADIVKRTQEGRIEKATQGIALGQGLAPFGYEKLGDRKTTRLAVIPGEAAVIVIIYDMFVNRGISITDIAHFLNAQQYPSPSQARNRIWQASRWNANAVARILRDPRYIGEFYAFKYITVKNDATNKRTAVLRDKELQIKQDFPDLAIIDRETFYAAQEIIDSRRNRYTFAQKYEYLFNTRVMCACGHKAGVQTMNKNGKAFQYYRCAHKRRAGIANSECKIPYMNSVKIDGDSWHKIEAFIRNPHLVLEELRAVQESQKIQHNDAVISLDSLDKIRKDYTKRLNRLYDDYQEELITKEVYKLRKQPLDTELEAAERLYREQQEILDRKVISDRDIAYVCKECRTIADLLDDVGVLEYEHKKRVIELLNITGEFVISGRDIILMLYLHNLRIGKVILDSHISCNMAVEYNQHRARQEGTPITLRLTIGRIP